MQVHPAVTCTIKETIGPRNPRRSHRAIKERPHIGCAAHVAYHDMASKWKLPKISSCTLMRRGQIIDCDTYRGEISNLFPFLFATSTMADKGSTVTYRGAAQDGDGKSFRSEGPPRSDEEFADPMAAPLKRQLKSRHLQMIAIGGKLHGRVWAHLLTRSFLW